MGTAYAKAEKEFRTEKKSQWLGYMGKDRRDNAGPEGWDCLGTEIHLCLSSPELGLLSFTPTRVLATPTPKLK